jgi:hypothetical protein
MREATTSEFGKLTLADLTEPVGVRRYTQLIGIFYPAGMEPQVGDHAACEDEIKRLKQLLAARDVSNDTVSFGHSFGFSRPAPKSGKPSSR